MSSLSGKLTAFVMQNDSLDNSLSVSDSGVSPSKKLKTHMSDNNPNIEEQRQKKKKKSFSERVSDITRQVDDIYQHSEYEKFDDYFDKYAGDEEDISLRNSLLSQGRKYARQTSVTTESSEIVRAFSNHEKNLHSLLDGVNADTEAIQKDIDIIRSARTGRNYKSLGELQAIKGQFHNIRLGIIKELDALTKNQIELQMKMNKDKQTAQDVDSDMLINKTITSIFGNFDRGAALGSVGGYSSVSGAIGADETIYDEELNDEDDYVHDSNNDDMMEGETAYLKYENMGAHLILTEHADHTYTVTAEDRDGNVLPDYPLPPNANHSAFEVNERLGTAQDDYHRKYVYRKE